MNTKNRTRRHTQLIAELLCQPYKLDAGSLEFLIEESLRSGKDGPIAVVTQALARPDLSTMHLENLGEFVDRARSTASVQRAFEHSVRRRGRCPRNRRPWLSRQIAPRQDEPPRAPSQLSPTSVAELNLRAVSGALGEFHILLDRVGSIPEPIESLRVAFGDFTYAAALAVVAQWILARRMVNRYEFVDCSPEMERYLDDIRFPAALRNPDIRISPDPMDWAVGLTRINRDQPTEKVTEKIVDIIHTFVDPSPEDRQALLVLISEMIENVHRHAASPVDGFAVAQVYPQKLKMGITLVDAGMGVQTSFKTGNPSVAIDDLRTDEDFLREAVKLHSTSKRGRHSGYGLYLLAELVARNRGTFLLASGGASLVGYQKQKRVVFDASNIDLGKGPS